jgi:2-methylcitrate dehydratase PrpD
MALRGELTAADYTDGAISDLAVLAFIPRIKVAVDQEIEAMGPAFRHAARVAVRSIDGRSFTREILHRRGSPENPVNRQDVERKFTSNVEALLGHASIDRLKQLASQLEVLPDAGELIKIMGAPFKNARAGVAQAPSAATSVHSHP